MTDYTSKKYGPPRVNMVGISPTEARAGVTATLSLLPEDTTYCSACKEEIPGLAVYVTRPRKELRSGYEIAAILHPECYGGEVA